MSTSTFIDLAEGMAELNTALTEEFEQDGAVCYLLKRGVNSSQFEEVEELVSGWFVEWNNYREQYVLSYATTEDFTDIQAQTSFIGYGVPDLNNEIDVYSISPDARDKVAPSGSSVFWKFYATRMPKERFNIDPFE